MHNFQIEPGTPSGKYDYESIMHYPAMAFAKIRQFQLYNVKRGKLFQIAPSGQHIFLVRKILWGLMLLTGLM